MTVARRLRRSSPLIGSPLCGYSAHSRWVWRVRPILPDNVIVRVRCRESRNAPTTCDFVNGTRRSRTTGGGRVRTAESCPRVPPGPPPPISDIGYPVSTVSPLSCRRVPGRDRGQRVSAASASSRDPTGTATPPHRSGLGPESAPSRVYSAERGTHDAEPAPSRLRYYIYTCPAADASARLLLV